MAPMMDNWGIYVHVPWCRRRCPYCDFYFEVGKSEAGFGMELSREYDARRSQWPNNEASTLYFGGGTPSLMPVSEIDFFMKRLASSKSGLKIGAEISLEANPEDINLSHISDLKAVGINRISLGVQSFDDEILRKLGRKHSSIEALMAVEIAVKSGLRVSVDFIFGVPGESQNVISQSINRLKEMGVGHISAYLLTVEPGTALDKQINKGRSERPDDDQQAQAYEEVQAVMEKFGYSQYEVSSYCTKGQESIHNRNYWGKGAYLGLGPSAHSMRILSDGSVERTKNISSIKAWRTESGNSNRDAEILDNSEALLESIAFGLRDLLMGVNLVDLSIKHQCLPPDGLKSVLENSIRKGWLIKKESPVERYYLTSLGVRFADGVAREILGLP